MQTERCCELLGAQTSGRAVDSQGDAVASCDVLNLIKS